MLVPAAAAGGDAAERTAFSPVPLAGFAEMARLGFVVIVVVAELGIRRTAPRAVGRRRPRELRRGGLALAAGKLLGRHENHEEGSRWD